MSSETFPPPGLQPVPVRLRRLGKEVGAGSTAPYFCTVGGILKFDSVTDAPHCVYDELVAMRLGIALGAPVAMGALVAAERGEGFVSLMIGASHFRLPDLHESQWREAAAAFPNHAASLLAFDIFIGNIDRASNLKVDMRRKSLNFFAAFDHSHCLLDRDLNIRQSLAELASDELLVDEHPFFRQPDIREKHVMDYVRRIGELPESLIRTACVLGEPLRQVSVEIQEALAEALCHRKKRLRHIVKAHKHKIFFW